MCVSRFHYHNHFHIREQGSGVGTAELTRCMLDEAADSLRLGTPVFAQNATLKAFQSKRTSVVLDVSKELFKAF